MMALTPLELTIRLAVAAFCSMLIGLDREVKDRPLGIRTYMLVALGACGFTTAIIDVAAIYNATGDSVDVDTGRVIDSIATGIGFLGAGAIMQSGKEIKGATTGAGIWATGAIGVACGFGLYWHAGLLTVMIVLVMTAINTVQHWCEKQAERKEAMNCPSPHVILPGDSTPPTYKQDECQQDRYHQDHMERSPDSSGNE